MKKDEKNMNYPLDFKLGKGDREFADANDKGLVVNYSDAAVKLCHWYKDDAKEHSGFTYVYIEFAFGWSPVAELEFDLWPVLVAKVNLHLSRTSELTSAITQPPAFHLECFLDEVF